MHKEDENDVHENIGDIARGKSDVGLFLHVVSPEEKEEDVIQEKRRGADQQDAKILLRGGKKCAVRQIGAEQRQQLQQKQVSCRGDQDSAYGGHTNDAVEPGKRLLTAALRHA